MINQYPYIIYVIRMSHAMHVVFIFKMPYQFMSLNYDFQGMFRLCPHESCDVRSPLYIINDVIEHTEKE